MILLECNRKESIWKYRFSTTYPLSWGDCLNVIMAIYQDLEEPEVFVGGAVSGPFVKVNVIDNFHIKEIPETVAIKICGKNKKYDNVSSEYIVLNQTDIFIMSVPGEYVKHLIVEERGIANEDAQVFVFNKFADSIEIVATEIKVQALVIDWTMDKLVEHLCDEDNFKQKRIFSIRNSTRSVNLTDVCNTIVHNWLKINQKNDASEQPKDENSTNKIEIEKSAPEKDTASTEEEMKELIECLPKSPVFGIQFEKEPGTFLNSKVGGMFYWPDDNPPELDFLCQINFSELPANDVFPKTGLLQFFVKDDDICGLDEEEGFKVVYHNEIHEDANQFRSAGEWTPVVKEQKMSFVLDEEHMTFRDYRFDSYYEEVYEMPDFEIFDQFCGEGSKLLGYPHFTQEDPRPYHNTGKYDTLLLQLDSIDRCVEWGDGGVANFFINSEKLNRHDFSDILYNWDCW